MKIPLSGSLAGFAGDIACSTFTTSSSKPLPFRFDGCATSIPSPRQQVLFRDRAATPTRKPSQVHLGEMEVIKRFGDKVFAHDVSASVAGADRRRHDHICPKMDWPQ